MPTNSPTPTKPTVAFRLPLHPARFTALQLVAVAVLLTFLAIYINAQQQGVTPDPLIKDGIKMLLTFLFGSAIMPGRRTDTEQRAGDEEPHDQ